MAQNSSWSYSVYTMDIEDFILVFLATVLTFTYLFMKKELFLRIWSKCKSSILKSNSCNRKAQEQPNRMTVLSLTDWHYRGEGNEYLAISLPQKRQILRLRKRACPVGILANIKDWLNQNSVDSALFERKAACFEKLNLEYYKLLVYLVGECYVQPAEEVLLVPSEIRKINKVISPLRPEHRKKKWIGYACGSLLTDYAYLPSDWEASICNGSTFAIELKPKQGWIAPRERLYNLCTYCLNQYIKLQNGETSEISQYCPMDLFSGNHLRMKHAIKCLLNTPQNNFKIFQDGVLVHGEGSNENIECVLNNWFGTSNKNSFISIDELCDIVAEALMKPLHKNSHECPKSRNMVHDVLNNCNSHSGVLIKHKMCNLSHESLPRGSVLDSILNLQKLDIWGSTTVSSYLKKYEAKYANIYAHAANAVTKMKGAGRTVSCAKCFFNESNISETLDNPELIIQQYLMSAIFKDCSLMLTFCKLKTTDYCKIEKQNIITTKNGAYAFRIGVFDLYPKPSSCIYKHVRKQILLSKTYKQILNGNFDNVKNPIETI